MTTNKNYSGSVRLTIPVIRVDLLYLEDWIKAIAAKIGK